jgi:hypothetical protein
VTGQVLDPGSPPGAGDDLVESRSRESITATWSFQHDEDVVAGAVLWAFDGQVGGQGDEEAL